MFYELLKANSVNFHNSAYKRSFDICFQKSFKPRAGGFFPCHLLYRFSKQCEIKDFQTSLSQLKGSDFL